MSLLQTLVRAVISVLAPFFLVVIGAGVTSLGINYEYPIILWTGLILVAAGILWGLAIFFYYGGAD